VGLQLAHQSAKVPALAAAGMPLMDTVIGATRYPTTNPPEAPGTNGLARNLCQV